MGEQTEGVDIYFPTKDESVVDLKRNLGGSAYEKLIPIVERYGSAAASLFSLLDSTGRAMKSGEKDEIILYSTYPLLPPSEIDPETGDYPNEAIKSTFLLELQARQELFQILKPTTVEVVDPDDNTPMREEASTYSKIYFLDPQSDLALSVKPETQILALKAVATSIYELYIVQFFYEEDGVIVCDERLAHLPHQYFKDTLITLPEELPVSILAAPIAYDELPGKKTPELRATRMSQFQATIPPSLDKTNLN